MAGWGKTAEQTTWGSTTRVTMESLRGFALLAAGLVLVLAPQGLGAAQAITTWSRHALVLEHEHSSLYAILVRLERARGVLFG